MAPTVGDSASPVGIGKGGYQRWYRLGGDDEDPEIGYCHILGESALHTRKERPVLVPVLKQVSRTARAMLEPEHSDLLIPVGWAKETALPAETLSDGGAETPRSSPLARCCRSVGGIAHR